MKIAKVHRQGFVSMQLHILRHRDTRAVCSADTVVAKDMRGDRQKSCQRSITFGAKGLSLLRHAITGEVLPENMTTPDASLPREGQSTTGTGGNPFLCCKIQATLPFPPSMLADVIVGFRLKQTIRVHLRRKNQCFVKGGTDTLIREASTAFDDTPRDTIKQILPVFCSLRIGVLVAKVCLPKCPGFPVRGKS